MKTQKTKTIREKLLFASMTLIMAGVSGCNIQTQTGSTVTQGFNASTSNNSTANSSELNNTQSHSATLSNLITNSPTLNNAQIQGYFVDSVVENLPYQTSNGSIAYTDKNGNFSCQKGEIVTFLIGNIELGKAPCQSIITPQTLASYGQHVQTTTSPSGKKSTTTKTGFIKTAINDPAVINRVRLLITLDKDGDLTNGIQLPSNTQQKKLFPKNKKLNFSKAGAAFDSEVVAQLNPNFSLLPVSTAKSHFVDSINKLKAGIIPGLTQQGNTSFNGQYDDTKGIFNETFTTQTNSNSQANSTTSEANTPETGNTTQTAPSENLSSPLQSTPITETHPSGENPNINQPKPITQTRPSGSGSRDDSSYGYENEGGYEN